MTSVVFDLAIVVLIAAAFGVIARMFKQPTILAYLATGIAIAAVGMLAVGANETFTAFSELGVMLLLFMVGLEINYTSLRLVGIQSLILGLGQIVFTFGIGYVLTSLLGFSQLSAIYIAIALTFSSTIVVVKLLSDRKEMNSLYGKLALGILLVQDMVVILILVVLAGMGDGTEFSIWNLFLVVIEAVALFVAMLLLGRKVLPIIFERVARSNELLFLVSMAWVFLIAAFVSKIGFSVEIAGFLAGIALANSSEHHEIAARVKPLRDFFLILFFVVLGASISFTNFISVIVPVLILSLFVLIGNPLIVMALMGLMGYRKRTGFMTGISIAQVSEFSLVLIAIGFKLGHIQENAVITLTAVGVITIVLSTYLIQYSNQIYKSLKSGLNLFERKKSIEGSMDMGMEGKPIVLVGYHRMGESIATGLPKDKLLVVEFDPEVIKKLKRMGYQVLFGDITDSEIFDAAKVEEAKLVISTSPDFEDNMHLIHLLKNRRLSHPPKVVVRAETDHEMLHLYHAGADYVLVPHFTAGQYFGKTIAIDPEMKVLSQLKARDLELVRGISGK
ncbi:sodium:proton exchanger [Candidatus Parcubacteria bacterium]|jgi:Kef-type K+ transport system membrane component KefB|nr:MAG: sodium:proton exchanger [Candidatus Parcubacteria bacterium]